MYISNNKSFDDPLVKLLPLVAVLLFSFKRGYPAVVVGDIRSSWRTPTVHITIHPVMFAEEST